MIDLPAAVVEYPFFVADPVGGVQFDYDWPNVQPFFNNAAFSLWDFNKLGHFKLLIRLDRAVKTATLLALERIVFFQVNPIFDDVGETLFYRPIFAAVASFASAVNELLLRK